jgi:hypothetical protein
MAFTIATISFARCGDAFLIGAQERVRLIRAAAYHHWPDILLTAGHALHSRKLMHQLAAGLAEDGSGATIVTEVHHDGNAKPRRLPGHALYVIQPNGSWQRLGRQAFGRRAETLANNAWRVDLFIERLPRRLIEVGGLRVFVLGCGELSAVIGRENPRFIHPQISDVIPGADIVLNPTHDRMGRAGVLNAKRAFLSQPHADGSRRIYVSCSNWNVCTESGSAQRPSAMIHSCYVNGQPVEPAGQGGGSEWGFLHRIYHVL